MQADAVIELKQVSRTYPLGEQAVLALKNVDLTVQRGEFIALMGPSGSGKSTLLNLLGGLDRADSGSLVVNGLALHTASDADLTLYRRWQVGFVFQRFNLLPRLTALENVALPLTLAGVPAAERQPRAQALLERVGLGPRVHHHPAELSGGEQQRASIARALVHTPALVLADEPTGNLDSATGEEVLGLLRQLNREQGVTLVVVTHDPEVAAYADRVVRLRDGEVVGIETQNTAPIPAAPINPTPREPGGFSWRDMARTAIDNLGRRPVRNILTGAGVLIGIVTLVAMVSFGVGVQAEVRKNFEALGLENVLIQPRSAEGSEDEFNPFAGGPPLQPITPALVAEIAALPEVASVTPLLSMPSGLQLTMEYDGNSAPARFSDSFAEGSFGPPGTTDLLAGQTLADSGNPIGVVLAVGLAEQLLPSGGPTYADLIGRTVTLTVTLPRGETHDFTAQVVGIRGGFSDRSFDGGLGLRAEIKTWWFAEPDLLEVEGYDGLVVTATGLNTVSTVVDFAEDRNLNAQSIEAFLNLANQVFSILNALLGSVGGLALLVAALGVANTMMMAIFERTREIGVLKALGAARSEVLRLFIVESGLLGLLGGVAGLIIGALLGKLIDWIAQQYLISQGVTGIGSLSVVPMWLAFGALGFATLIGVLAGIYPAARAASLDPVAALRYE